MLLNGECNKHTLLIWAPRSYLRDTPIRASKQFFTRPTRLWLAARRRSEVPAARRGRRKRTTKREKSMAETVLDPPLAQAISPIPPDERRRARAAESPPWRLSPTSGDLASATRPRPPFECIALLLQGGGALGAYQAGVFEALAEADLHPDWIAGISIGAINGALIAGNAAETRVDKLRTFWGGASRLSRFGIGMSACFRQRAMPRGSA
jgi:hypothetical protein